VILTLWIPSSETTFVNYSYNNCHHSDDPPQSLAISRSVIGDGLDRSIDDARRKITTWSSIEEDTDYHAYFFNYELGRKHRCLVSLVKRRTRLVQEQKLHGPEQRTSNERVQRVGTLALDRLYQEAYGTSAAKQEKLRTKLENRLRHGRNWSSLVDRFSVGTLALVPTGKHTSLTDPQSVSFSGMWHLLTCIGSNW
jgi:hypothetical protein